jgi:predicted nucleotidyltransferase
MLFLDIFQKLNEKKLDYVVIGGVALVMHGVVRLTADLDLMVDMEQGNLQKLIDAMAELGYRARIPEPPAALLDPEKRRTWHEEKNMEVFSFYDPAKPLALLDVMIHELIAYPRIKRNAVIMAVGPVRIPVASIDDLIALKKISGRPQDLEDIKALEAERHHEK